uniref:Uncharacterized protein n=1 Tax=Arundo donax TaxID=35708 RepID=A0A0A8YKG5_ARUDO
MMPITSPLLKWNTGAHTIIFALRFLVSTSSTVTILSSMEQVTWKYFSAPCTILTSNAKQSGVVTSPPYIPRLPTKSLIAFVLTFNLVPFSLTTKIKNFSLSS